MCVCVRRYNELSQLLAGDLSNDQLIILGKEFSELSPLMSLVEEREARLTSIAELRLIEDEEHRNGANADQEMIELSKAERKEFELKLTQTENNIVSMLTPRDEHDDRNIVLEVRAGTG
jgi:peptide chain release factor 1